jgi:excinuclease ABC subunit A
MCEGCKGLGIKLRVDKKKLMPDQYLKIKQGAVDYFKNLVDSENLE